MKRKNSKRISQDLDKAQHITVPLMTFNEIDVYSLISVDPDEMPGRLEFVRGGDKETRMVGSVLL
jgi:hypothetical protein